MLETLVDVIDEADHGQRPSQIGVAGRRLHPRNQAEKIRRQDEQKQRAEKSDVGIQVVIAEQIPGEARHSLGYHLRERTQCYSFVGQRRIGRLLQRPARHQGENQKDSHDEPGSDQDRRNLPAETQQIDEINRIQTSFPSISDRAIDAMRGEFRQTSIRMAAG